MHKFLRKTKHTQKKQNTQKNERFDNILYLLKDYQYLRMHRKYITKTSPEYDSMFHGVSYFDALKPSVTFEKDLLLKDWVHHIIGWLKNEFGPKINPNGQAFFKAYQPFIDPNYFVSQ